MHRVEIKQPTTLADAVANFRDAGDAMFLSGGMTLVPSMKAHLAAPEVLVDLSRVAELTGITDQGDSLRVGAFTRLVDIERSEVVASAIPMLGKIASIIADRHVRNRGTIGGSIANNDPAADFTAAVLVLGATLVTDRREISADDYFTGLFETELEEDEILVAMVFPKPEAAAYAKHAHPASGYAVGGVCVARFGQGWRVAVTGSGADGVFRIPELETALADKSASQAIAAVDFSALDVVDDAVFPAPFRQAMIKWLAEDALAQIG
ncbi:carbon-monoxide dehydrogenase medium subunit [Maritimibacter alkaliphilus HTCC2654]|uniref:Carbon monoxide dehydrogenase chain C n=1 Tax=Maritimibacter alkaliphilus HTCC2654 TaxID=314271 RepID=A3VDL4_9RHOB|nr:FAD binding domain-containing protein [Maritimibacter alkaliphilus]EAQ13603.1 carbon monoxide dehydrogenase chain C [Maritimibacter alkaliphilus HTCC2654]TYP83442.1 carbon-monoxide dehydrogenase medium subunit [Maritimibacter alkaliphilus HTCC2654]